MPDTPFEPNLVNSVCFLVNWIVQLTTFGVNYIGHPFNTSLQDNKGLAVCLRCGDSMDSVSVLSACEPRRRVPPYNFDAVCRGIDRWW